jgi:hypothetical protein
VAVAASGHLGKEAAPAKLQHSRQPHAFARVLGLLRSSHSIDNVYALLTCRCSQRAVCRAAASAPAQASAAVDAAAFETFLLDTQKQILAEAEQLDGRGQKFVTDRWERPNDTGMLVLSWLCGVLPMSESYQSSSSVRRSNSIQTHRTTAHTITLILRSSKLHSCQQHLACSSCQECLHVPMTDRPAAVTSPYQLP